MKSNAPWSVKGIERDARETAKEAARREGMTVGEWLNQMIYSQAEGGGPNALSDTEVEGLKLRDIVTAIEHLRNRVAEAETKSAAALSELTRSMGGFVERVQRLERVKPAEGSYQDIAQRVEKLERAGGDRQRIEALKALEKAIAQVAVQFNSAQRTTLNRLDSAEAQLQEFAARIDRVGGGGAGEPAELGSLKSAIEHLAERVAKAERIAQEAASLKSAAADSSDPDFVERTGARLRVLGDEIKRGGDQIRALEGAIGKLSGQIEAAEKRSADGVQKVSETIAEVRAQLLKEERNDTADVETMIAAARRDTDHRLEALQRSLEDINARFEALGRKEPPPAETKPPVQSNADLAAEIEDSIAGAAPALAARRAPAPAIVTEDPGDVAEEIEDAVAAIEAEAETDPFAFSDEIEEEGEETAEDFSFQLDDETEAEGEDDIAVAAEEEDQAKDARSLLAEVRSALSGGEFAEKPQAKDDEDDDISALFADEDREEDAQAPNTASLGAHAAPAAPARAKEPSGGSDKENMVQAARRLAREAAEDASEEDRPRRSQLTAKQRAILAARARQKLAAEAAAQPQKPAPAPAARTPAPAAPPAIAATDEDDDGEEENPRGRFGKFAAALASARARLGRKKDTVKDKAESSAPSSNRIQFDDEGAPRNGDRAALKTLQSTASARPLTMALAAAIVLAIAALAYLMKDFVFKPQESAHSPARQTEQTAQRPPAAKEEPLTSVPEAPAIDPQALYAESMGALAAAKTEEEARAAIAKLQDAAALGFPPAQLQLGELYKTGQGVEQDLGQARVWFRRAANGGNVLAMHRIGVMTARGDGGPADPQEAVAWFEKAANFGLVDSQYNLGAIYHPSESGGSAVQDAAKAYYWYSLAARNGDDQARPLAAGVSAAISSSARAEIDARVAAWTAKPANESANASSPIE